MSTFAQLADRVEAVLHGYTENTEPAAQPQRGLLVGQMYS